MVMPGTLYSPIWSINALVRTKPKKSLRLCAIPASGSWFQAGPQNTVVTCTALKSGPPRYVRFAPVTGAARASP